MPTSAARRFVALYFDDVNTPFENLARARDAADHFLTSSIQPGDRVALYTSSGQKQLDFTDNLAQVHQALLDLRPRPIVGAGYILRRDPTLRGVPDRRQPGPQGHRRGHR